MPLEPTCGRPYSGLQDELLFAPVAEFLVNPQAVGTCDELRRAIATSIEGICDRPCRQRGLGRPTPIKFEPIYNQTVLAA